MLLPAIITLGVFLAIRMMLTPGQRDFSQKRIVNMRQRYYDLLHIEYSEDDVYEFFEQFKRIEGVRGLTSELHSKLQNRKYAVL